MRCFLERSIVAKPAMFAVVRLVSMLVLFTVLTEVNANAFERKGDEAGQIAKRKLNDKFTRESAAVVGVYKGILTINSPFTVGDVNPASNNTRELSGELSVYLKDVAQGIGRSGLPLHFPKLFAQLKLDAVGELDDTLFSVKFDRDSGALELTPVTETTGESIGGFKAVSVCPVGPRDLRLAISGKIVNGELQADVNGTNGYLGRVSMRQTSNKISQPIRDQRERLSRALSRVVGTWSGASKIRNANGSVVETISNIYLYTEEIVVAEGLACPTLRAQFRLPKFVGQLEDTFMNAAYREGSSELSLSYAAPPADSHVCSVGPTDAKLAFNGSFDGKGSLSGLLKGSAGEMGSVNVKQISKDGIAPVDQRDRLVAAYLPIVGTYAGQFTQPGSKYDNFPVWIELALVDSKINDYLTCPTLKGQYRRPDLISNLGSLVLNAQYLPSSPVAGRLTLESLAADGTSGIPGHTYLKATTEWKLNGTKDAQITGEMQWWQSRGNLNAVKCPRPNVSRLGKCK